MVESQHRVEASSWTRERPHGATSREYLDPEPKLLWSSNAVLRIGTPEGLWVTSPSQALWIPAEVPNRYVMRSAGSVQALLVRPAPHTLPSQCTLVRIAPEAATLLLAITARGHHGTSGPRGDWYGDGAYEGAPITALFEQLVPLPSRPLPDPFGESDPRLAPLVEMLRRDPNDHRSLNEWASLLGMSVRTLTRLFALNRDTTFGSWRRQVRLLYAVERLALGDDVRAVAQRLGYKSVSMFVSIFRRSIGTTPARYFRFEGGPTLASSPS